MSETLRTWKAAIVSHVWISSVSVEISWELSNYMFSVGAKNCRKGCISQSLQIQQLLGKENEVPGGKFYILKGGNIMFQWFSERALINFFPHPQSKWDMECFQTAKGKFFWHAFNFSMFHSWGFWRYSKPWNLSRAEKYIFPSKASRAWVHIGTTWAFVSLLCLIPWQKIQSCSTFLIKPLELPMKWKKLWVTCAPHCLQTQCRETTWFDISNKKQKGDQAGSTQDTGRVIFSWDWLLFTSFPAVTRKGLLKWKHSDEDRRNHCVWISLFHLATTTSASGIFPPLSTHWCTTGCNGQEWWEAGSREIPFGVTHRPSSLPWASLE